MNEKQICPFSLPNSIYHVKEYANEAWSGRNRSINGNYGCIKNLCAIYNDVDGECSIYSIAKAMIKHDENSEISI